MFTFVDRLRAVSQNRYLLRLVVAGNLLSSLMSSYDDDISDDGTSDDQRIAEPSTVDLDWELSSSTSQQPASILPMYWFSVQRYWITLSFAETKVSNFSLRPKVWSAEREVMLNLVGDQSIKPNHFYFCLSKCKQIRHEWRRSLGRCNNRHGPKAENFKFSFLHLPVRRDDRSETWFKTFCILIRSQALVSE